MTAGMEVGSKMWLARIAANPDLATVPVATPAGGVLAPLAVPDEGALKRFFGRLSPRTRERYGVGFPAAEARERCSTIARYDKLRLVLRLGHRIVALSEFSLDLVPADHQRYAGYRMPLRQGRDIRWGLCVEDAWQRRGVGSAVAAASFVIARRLGRERVLLWGGVRADNLTAIRLYRTLGFAEMGRFDDPHGDPTIDMILPLTRPTTAGRQP